MRTLRGVTAGIVLLASACSDTSDPSDSARSYRMGFSAIPPRLDFDLLVRSLDMWSTRADAAIMHVSVPWRGLLEGLSADSLLTLDGIGIAQYYASKQLALTVMIDVTDGLNRAAEAPELVALGRSITEPAVQQLYRQYARAVATRLNPDYLGLAAETNLIRVAAPAPVYNAMVTMTNAAAADLRAQGTTAELYVSVQVEVAWGRLQGTSQFQGVEQDFRDFPFIQVLGLSSYPYLGGFTEPEQIPQDYFTRVRGTHNLDLLLVEGGWASQSTGGFTTSPEKQARYIRHLAKVADASGLIRWFQLSFTDLDTSAFPDAPPILVLFATLGLVNTELQPKPSLQVWDSVFAVRRQ
jgi:hypothetical protein